MTQQITATINDVNLDAVGALVAAVQDDEHKGATTWAAHLTWDGAFTSSTRIRQFAPLPSDEPATLGGGDTAPNPVEHLLASFGQCLAVGYAANASIAGIEIDSLKIDLQGDLDLRVFLGLAEGHAGFSAIRASVKLASSASDEQIAALHERVQATCPVGHTLANPVAVEVTLA